MTEVRRGPTRFAPAAVEVQPLPGGGMLLRSPQKLGSYPPRLGEHLRRWALEAPDRTWLAERDARGEWRRVSYAEALRSVEALAQALLGRGLSSRTPAMFLSENSVDFGLLAMACLYIGVPVAPVSPAYSLVSQDHAKLRYVFDLVKPKLVYVSRGTPFAKALAALPLDGVEVVVSADPVEGRRSTLFADLLSTRSTADVEAAFEQIGPDSLAKILFTSGSTGMPKGVMNTHRMMCSNQQSIAQIWPFVEERPPVFVDWLPWNHTFGGNKTFNLVLRNGGTLYIDHGKALPGAIEKTVANLREISPTIYWNVPKGYDILLPYLEADRELRESFFRELDLLFYAAAALPQNLWARLEKLSLETRGELVPMASGWGSTETSPSITMVHYPISQAGIIGIPMPGIEVKLLPNAGKLEMRVRGPNVTPGYYGQEDITRDSFDEEGFFRMGDAGK
ncbi:MAG: AMP-binding protein, partial [Deltaproteobacteria bacterium]|nr:AMP-binding protein [Deltaproteobacteria bacterium]